MSDEFLLKIFLSRLAPAGACRDHITRHLAQSRERLGEYENIRKLVLAERHGHPHLKFWLLLLDHGITMRRAEMRWCEEALRALTSERA